VVVLATGRYHRDPGNGSGPTLGSATLSHDRAQYRRRTRRIETGKVHRPTISSVEAVLNAPMRLLPILTNASKR
jgi:hypothetical protein